MAKNISGQQWAERLIAGASQQKFAAGVQNTTKMPGALAVAQQDAMVQGFNDAVQSGRWAQNTLAADAYWKSNTVAKAANYTNGLNAAKQRLAQIGQSVMANANAVSQMVAGMAKGPKGGSEGLARFDAARQAMIAFKKQGKLR